MSRKKETSPEGQTEITGTPAPRKRSAKSEIVVAAENQLKEARSLGKILHLIPGLSAWGCGQVALALTKNAACVPLTIGALERKSAAELEEIAQ